jgi:ABC-type glycerol-3-phosphate transport system substrate-binding protein
MADSKFRPTPNLPVATSQINRHMYTRRQMLKHGGLGTMGLIIVACTGEEATTTVPGVATTVGPGETALTGNLAFLFDYGYAGLPGSMAEFFRTAGQNFADQEGIEIEFTEVALADLAGRVTAAHAAGEGPVVQTYYTNYSSYEFFSQGVVEALGPWVGGEEEMQHWLFTGHSFEGKRYNCPILAEIMMMAVNKDIMGAAGVDVPLRWESWDAMIVALRKVKANGDLPVMIGSADGFNSEKWMMAGEMEFANDLTDITRWGLGETSIDDPVASSWIDRLDQLLTEGLVNSDAADITEQQALERFAAGEGSVMLLYPGVVFALGDEKYDVVGLWQGEGAISAPMAVGGTGIVMTEYGENKEAAGQFLAYLHAPEQSKLFFETTSELPTDDRFDSSILPPMAKKTWDLITAEPPPYWIHDWLHYDIVFSLQYPLGQKVVAGVSTAAELKAEYDTLMKDYRAANPEAMELLQGFFDAVSG